MPIAIEVIPLGSVAVAARAWRHRGRRLLTAIVKASFDIRHDAPMTAAQPAAIVTEEKHYRNNPVASLVRASDLALLVPKPEVVVVGYAYAGPGQKLQSTTVRLAVARDTTMLINKRLDIVGDRRARPGEPPPEPKPFDRIPVLYERALGGISSRENPVGVGLGTDPDGLLTLPNVLPPPQGGVGPAGLGPIPSAWPLRQKRRGSLSWAAANSSPDVDVPDDFDDAYFQTAPADQQVAELRGGELIAIVNMHPELATLRAFLPTSKCVALAQTASGERIPLQLRIDTVHIQPDMMRAEVVYRGFSVISDEKLQHLRLAGALEEPGVPYPFPDLASMGGLVLLPSDGTKKVDLGATAVITEEPPPQAVRTRAPTQKPTGQGPAPEPAQPGRGHAGTMIIEPDAPPPATASPPRARSAPPPPAQQPHHGTLVIEPEAAQPQSLPFRRANPKPPSSPGKARKALAAQGGTPWARQPPSKAPAADGKFASTLEVADTEDASGFGALEDEETLARPTKQAAEEPPRTAGTDTADKKVEAVDPAPPAQPPPPEPPPANRPPPEPPPAQRPVPKTNIGTDLYKRFKR